MKYQDNKCNKTPAKLSILNPRIVSECTTKNKNKSKTSRKERAKASILELFLLFLLPWPLLSLSGYPKFLSPSLFTSQIPPSCNYLSLSIIKLVFSITLSLLFSYYIFLKLNKEEIVVELMKVVKKQRRAPPPPPHGAPNMKYCVNDHPDILIEILKRLDDRSLSVAACVCRLWCSISRNDNLWENLCFRHVSPHTMNTSSLLRPPRPVVLALGGYRRLYMVCLRPLLNRLRNESSRERRGRVVWNRENQVVVQLSISLFSIHCYERRLTGGGGGASSSSSLMFLCQPVNVS